MLRLGAAAAICLLGSFVACSSSSGSGSGPGGQPDATSDGSMMPDAAGMDASDAKGGDATSADGTTMDSSPADGATTDGGTVDASDGSPGDATLDAMEDAPQDAPADAPEAASPSLCPGNFLFCDGFEQNLTNWTAPTSTGGSVAVDSVHVYRGTKALHVNIDPIVEAGVSAYAMVQKYGPQPWPTHFFTRFFAYFPSPSPASTAGLLDLIENGPPYSGTELRITPPNAGLEMQTYGTDAGLVTWDSADAASALDQWVCFEVEVDTIAETAHVYMNDTEVTDLMRGGLTLPQLGNTSVGISFFQANVQGPVDAWIDEVAVNSARIGCAN